MIVYRVEVQSRHDNSWDIPFGARPIYTNKSAAQAMFDHHKESPEIRAVRLLEKAIHWDIREEEVTYARSIN